MARRRRIVFGTASAAAMALVAATAAFAALNYSQYDYPLANNGQMSDYSGCSDDTEPIGGGIYITGGGLGIEVNFTFPADSPDANRRPDGWDSGANSDASGDQTLTDHTICSDQVLSYRSERVALPLNTDRTARADCPGDMHVASGGVNIIQPNDLQREVVESYPVDDGDPDSEPDDGWVGRASNYASAGPAKLKVFAVCAAKAVSYRSSTHGVAGGTQVGDEARCPPGTRVVGGGMEITKPGNVTESATIAPFDGGDDDNKADDGWESWVNNEGAQKRRMTTWAVCQ